MIGLHLLLGLGLKANIPVTDLEKTLAAALKLIEEQGEEIQKLRSETQKLLKMKI